MTVKRCAAAGPGVQYICGVQVSILRYCCNVTVVSTIAVYGSHSSTVGRSTASRAATLAQRTVYATGTSTLPDMNPVGVAARSGATSRNALFDESHRFYGLISSAVQAPGDASTSF